MTLFEYEAMYGDLAEALNDAFPYFDTATHARVLAEMSPQDSFCIGAVYKGKWTEIYRNWEKLPNFVITSDCPHAFDNICYMYPPFDKPPSWLANLGFKIERPGSAYSSYVWLKWELPLVRP